MDLYYLIALNNMPFVIRESQKKIKQRYFSSLGEASSIQTSKGKKRSKDCRVEVYFQLVCRRGPRRALQFGPPSQRSHNFTINSKTWPTSRINWDACHSKFEGLRENLGPT